MIVSPKVCVAICNYNHEKYLKQSIKSIVDQTYENLDIAVVDDGSDEPDVVKSIVESMEDKRIRYIPIQNNRGKWNALNVAFASTDAEICTSHDADDVSLPWRISAQLGVLSQTATLHNLCGFVSCWSDEQINQQQTSILRNTPENIKMVYGDEVAKSVLAGFQTPGINHYFTGKFETAGVSAMFHKSLWDLGFRFNPPGCGIRTLMSEDSDFNFRVTSALRRTSLLLETPYLYRRNTSTNKEEK